MGDPGGSTSSLDDEFESRSGPCCEVAELPEEVTSFIERQRVKKVGWTPLARFLNEKGYEVRTNRLENHWRRHVA